MRARAVVLATGAIERPLVFPGNDRPGIMLADAARTYVNRYGVRPGARAVVLTTCDSGYAAAFDLKRAGIEVAAIVDPRPDAAARADGSKSRLARPSSRLAGGIACRPCRSGRLALTAR